MRQFAFGKRCPDEDDSGVAGTQRFLYHREYLFAFGLRFQGFFSRSNAERAWNGFKSGKWHLKSVISLQNRAFSLLLWNCQTQKFCFLHKKTVQSAQKKHAVPLIGGASEIWTLAALQTPYRISSATPSTSWVMLLIVIPQNLLRKKERKVGENSKYLIVENSGFLTMSRYKINGSFQNACLISSAPSYDLLGNAPCSGFLPDTKLV